MYVAEKRIDNRRWRSHTMLNNPPGCSGCSPLSGQPRLTIGAAGRDHVVAQRELSADPEAPGDLLRHNL
jgi:hypothetical protein